MKKFLLFFILFLVPASVCADSALCQLDCDWDMASYDILLYASDVTNGHAAVVAGYEHDIGCYADCNSEKKDIKVRLSGSNDRQEGEVFIACLLPVIPGQDTNMHPYSLAECPSGATYVWAKIDDPKHECYLGDADTELLYSYPYSNSHIGKPDVYAVKEGITISGVCEVPPPVPEFSTAGAIVLIVAILGIIWTLKKK